MSQKNLDIYKKYLDGSINRIELDLLLEYFEVASEAELLTLIDFALESNEKTPVTSKTEESLLRVQLRLEKHTGKTVRAIRQRILRYIASVAALVTLFIGYLVFQQNQQTTEYYAPDPILSIQTSNGNTVNIKNQKDSSWNIDGVSISRVDSQTIRISGSKNSTNHALRHVISTNQSDFRVILDDGSIVTLNANSSLALEIPFTKDKREVSLSGEGYFQVSHDASRPFKVIANHTLIEVLGTQFNVRNYAEENQIETALIQGKIALTHSKGGQKIILSPGQKVLSTDTGIVLSDNNNAQTTAWLNRYFEYENQQLSRVLLDICRWYGTTLDTQTVPDDKRIYMKIEKSLPLSKVLNLLEETSDLYYHIEDGKIRIQKKESHNNK